MSDETSLAYIFQQTDTELLVGIVTRAIDPRERAANELSNRGMNHEGKWVGFDAALRIYIDFKARLRS